MTTFVCWGYVGPYGPIDRSNRTFFRTGARRLSSMLYLEGKTQIKM